MCYLDARFSYIYWSVFPGVSLPLHIQDPDLHLDVAPCSKFINAIAKLLIWVTISHKICNDFMALDLHLLFIFGKIKNQLSTNHKLGGLSFKED